jgi:hypothetical protein
MDCSETQKVELGGKVMMQLAWWWDRFALGALLLPSNISPNLFYNQNLPIRKTLRLDSIFLSIRAEVAAWSLSAKRTPETHYRSQTRETRYAEPAAFLRCSLLD